MTGRHPAALAVAVALIGSLAGVAGPAALHASAAGAATNPCGPPVVNPVACENTLPGDPRSDWSVTDPGDLSIQGFATDHSAQPGQTISFKIKTPVSSYHIDILRFGWYQGNGARKVAANLKPSVALPQSQPPCLVDNSNTTGLVDCGNWAVSATWTIPSTAVSGVYAAHLVRDDTGGDSLIMFDVRDDVRQSTFVYQTSDVTREAYNQYGGNSLYTCTVACPTHNPPAQVYSAAYKVSFNRPNTAASLGSQYSFFDAEFPLVEFLEQNGYDVSYISGVDADRAGSLLKNHRVFISSGHDEYWSGGQRANVQAARDAGVNLAFFSANEMFWKVRYEKSIDASATANRTLVSYKDTHFPSPIDPQYPSVTTGTWRDTRYSPPADSGKPENALTGTAYTVDPPATFPMEVPAAYAKLRLWRNTSVANLAAGQVATLATDTLGYEFDEDLDNGVRPPGLIHLSSTTKSVEHHLIDFGNTEPAGVATHNLTLYRAASGALVFGAGTVQWSFGLEPGHNPSADVRMQQATVNLFADMGAQPATLMAGLTPAVASTDVSPPSSSITSPAAGATIADGTTVTITGSATDAGGGQVGGVEVSTDGGASWHPARGTTSWSYTWNVATYGSATIKTRAADDSGNIETPSAGVTVTVTCPCQIFPTAVVPATPDAGDASALELGVKFTTTTDGFATGVRFFKSAANTGTHLGNLWSAGGQLLASGTFSGESGSGWQQVSFAQPVHLLPNTVYVASYHTNTGHYAADQTFSGQAVISPPLIGLQSSTDTSATVNVSGPNGVFAPGSVSAFPTQSFLDTNYGVDVTFQPSAGGPFVASETPASNATNVAVGAAVTATFNESVQPPTISFVLTDPTNATVPATLTYTDATHTATLQPNAALTPSTVYKATVSGAKDAANQQMTSTSWTFTTTAGPATCPCTIWPASTTPTNSASSDGNAIEVGVKFRSDTNGFITGIRFYKGAANTGTHIGDLWTTGGTLLASATFSAETAAGWQQVSFASPVAVTAGTDYVASYHTNAGHYAADSSYFTSTGVDRAPLHALKDGDDGGNGVYNYSATSTFPASTFGSTNYWVDVAFTTTPPPMVPTVTTSSPAPNASNVAVGTAVTATFNESVQQPTISFVLTDPTNATVPATLTYTDATHTATLQPNTALAPSTVYKATVSGAKDPANQQMTSTSWTFTTAAGPATCPCTIWPGSTTPGTSATSDGNAVELGVKFRSDTNGFITGIRFYKGATNTGTHIGNLWTTGGTLLASATFFSETATGWQQVSFASPVAVTAGTDYVASYHTNTGHYAADNGYFTSTGFDAAPLHALKDGADGGNGVYNYSATSAFPASTFGSTNYWVDVAFATIAPPPTPTVTGTSPAANATNVSLGTAVTATFNESVQQPTISFVLTDPANVTVPATLTYTDATHTATIQPNAALAPSTVYKATVSGAKDAANQQMTSTSWTFTSGGGPATCPCTIWPASTTPTNSASSDGSAVELGVKFRSDTNGFVTGIRFYKGAANTGTHVGNLWTTGGTLLASATFSAETATGWQQVSFASPVAITAGTDYVASYHTDTGHYAADNGYFASTGVDAAPLHALKDGDDGGNGVYNYSATSAFPASTFGSTNYWVDVVTS